MRVHDPSWESMSEAVAQLFPTFELAAVDVCHSLRFFPIFVSSSIDWSLDCRLHLHKCITEFIGGWVLRWVL